MPRIQRCACQDQHQLVQESVHHMPPHTRWIGVGCCDEVARFLHLGSWSTVMISNSLRISKSMISAASSWCGWQTLVRGIVLWSSNQSTTTWSWWRSIKVSSTCPTKGSVQKLNSSSSITPPSRDRSTHRRLFITILKSMNNWPTNYSWR